MIAYKFLDGQGRGVFSGFRWTAQPPGTWIEAAGVAICREGVHGCRPADLAWWVNEDLWEIELDGDVIEAGRKIAARRGRLRRCIDDWSGGVMAEFAEATIVRARDAALAVGGGHREMAPLGNSDRVDDIRAAARAALATLEPDSAEHVAAGLVVDAAHFATEHICHAPFISACAAGHAASARSGRRDDWRAAFVAERAWQSAWISGQLDLPSS
ncbi:MAG: hypothetical protein AB1679_03550 [Actinomycetota bacterium]